ncbi:DNA-directed RNA polymerase V subunit 5C-like isoform X2 [Salvia splendens]|uniref:DNA-directed RNA polymerase V subunit 5C-like isoform X2 n=1 Tax=Salvia splendens TaxID=180675 RepID=UPI001C260ED1|nr:DNA-directed RNA polymerase V subunit 5C-like isoform X2 [Salvia splendens]
MQKVCIKSLVENGSLDSRRYYLARRTVIEMLSDRGYQVPGMDAQLRCSLADFRAEFGDHPEADRLRITAHRASNPSRKMRKQNAVGILSQIADKEMLDKVILVVQSKMNSHAQKVLDEYSVKVETFLIADLLVNISKHFLEPKYEILSPGEKDTLLKKHAIEDNGYFIHEYKTKSDNRFQIVFLRLIIIEIYERRGML